MRGVPDLYPKDGNGVLEFVIRTLEDMRAQSEIVLEFLDEHEIGEDSRYDVRLTLFELCGNILKHSNCPCRVTVELTDRLISIQIESDVAFDVYDSCGTLSAESGRGVFLVKSLVQRLQYFDNGKNIVAEIARC